MWRCTSSGAAAGKGALLAGFGLGLAAVWTGLFLSLGREQMPVECGQAGRSSAKITSSPVWLDLFVLNGRRFPGH
jgi:hypothetical protein